MDNEAFNLVKGRLAIHNQAAKKLTPCDELLQYRVMPETELPPLEFLFKMNGVECFPRAELVANTGKAKSGKTFFLSIVMACCLKKNVLGLERVRDTPIRVLWYDTEQSAQSTQKILVNRIIPLSRCLKEEGRSQKEEGINLNPNLNPEEGRCEKEEESQLNDQFFVFNVRGIGWEKRRELLATAINEIKPDLVIVDGIKDLITDINDGTQATTVVEDQMGLAQTYNCCIVDVLHQNKNDADRNMRGWIGTELTNKAFEVWSCAIVSNTDTFKVEQIMSRMKRCEENLYYQLDDNALPVSCQKPDEQPRDPASGRYISKKNDKTGDEKKQKYKVDWAKLNRDYILPNDSKEPMAPEDIPWDLGRLFTDAMEGCSFLRFAPLMAATMRISCIEDRNYYYQLLERAKKEHYLTPGKDVSGQQGFYLVTPDQRKRILATEEEELRKQQEPVQGELPFKPEENGTAPF